MVDKGSTTMFFIVFGLMEYFIDSGDKPAIIEYPITQFFMLMVLLILVAIEVILKSVENVMFQTLVGRCARTISGGKK